jgi:hypothetical protein
MHDELESVLRDVRMRWRLKLALRGLTWILVAAIVSLLFTSIGMERLGFTPQSIVVARVIVYVAILGAAAAFLLWPLVRRVPAERVALYLEEHEPSLDAAVATAVEQERRGHPEGTERPKDLLHRIRSFASLRMTRAAVDPHSPRAMRSEALAKGVISSALSRLRAVDRGRRVERNELQRGSAILGGLMLAAVVVLLAGPSFLRHGARALFAPWRSAEAAMPYTVDIAPGDTTIPRGGDLEIQARLGGFDAEEVTLVATRGAADPERITMPRGTDSAQFIVRLFDLDQQTEYYVEAGPVRSPMFRIAVADLPSVKRIDLEYRYPDYTRLSPHRVEDGGDIAAVRGTQVLVEITPTISTHAGRLVLDGKDTIALTAADSGQLEGVITVSRSGFYKVELADAAGRYVPASLDYAIDMLEDGAPSVSIAKPGRDAKVSSLEEVFIEARAEDDFGVQRLDLVYSVNGGEQKTVGLHRGRLKEVSAGHTLYLEEMNLEAGDVISYFARATDASRTATTDIYFLEVRPFNREYRQAEQAGGAGSARGDASPGALSQRQREIIAATFKVVRDRPTTSEKETRENISTILLSQGRLREQVATLEQRLRQRGVLGSDSIMEKIAEELPRAVDAMKEAEEKLARREAEGALPHEQRALQHLQRAEAAYREVQVSFEGQPGGGMGGDQPNAEDLADLFELENDKLRNQYEQVERGDREQADRSVDETLERLRQLAARQQQEAERMRARAEQMSRSGSGGGSQRQLAQETEELARQLERLAREQSSQELNEAARRLREAANAMRRSATGERDQSLAETASALKRLEEARRRLDAGRTSRLDRDVRDLVQRAERLAQEQRDVARDVEELRAGDTRDLGASTRLMQRKDAMANEVADIEARLDRISTEARREQREASRKLQEAANAIRESRLRERILFSKGVIQSGSPEYARSLEEQIGSSVDDVKRRIEEAAGAVRESGESRAARALDRARDIARGLESLEERAQNSRGAEGAEGVGDAEGRERSGTPQTETGGGQGARVGGAFTPEQIRQFMREYRERRGDAEALRRELSREGVDVTQLNRMIEQLRALEAARIYNDVEELQRLQTAVVEGFKSFEFALRHAMEGDLRDRPLVGGTSDVPPEFRKMVEEYYKVLARRDAAGRR